MRRGLAASSSARILMFFGVTFFVAVVALTLRGVRAATTPAESYVTSVRRPPGTPPPKLFRVPEFALTEAGGGEVTRASLRGAPWVQTFLFTRCTTVCPMLTARLRMLQRRTVGRDVRFVSVSVDPVHDDLATLRDYRARWGGDDRWRLLAPNGKQLQAFARGMRVAVVDGPDARDPILHSRLVTLVDGEGWVRGVFDSDDESAWSRLEEDLALVSQEAKDAKDSKDAKDTNIHDASLSAQPVDRAERALGRLGCEGCHARAAVAPPLASRATRRLVDGRVVAWNAEYLRESILRPSAKVVAGYAPRMPSYAGALSEAELDALVAELLALPAANDVEPEASRVPSAPVTARDPICGMEVTTVDPSLTVHVGDHDEHFCSEACRTAFLARGRAPAR